jgi:hypothetical protein
MFRCLLWAIAAAIRPRVLLIADNLCLRQQLLVLQRRKPRPRLKDADRRFWVLACRWFVDWQTSVLIVKPDTVLRWHRQGWRNVLAPTFAPHSEDRPPSNCAAITGANPAHDHREPTYMSTRHVKSPHPLFLSFFLSSSFPLSFV